MSEVLLITSGGKGAGKTTLCAALASCLAALDQSVLAVDCGIGCSSLSRALGMKGTVTFLDVMMENRTLSDAARHPVIPGLQLLTAPTKTRAGLIDDIVFGQVLEEAAETYDWVLLDAGDSGLGFDLASAYAARAILVARPDETSLSAAEQTAERLQSLDPRQLVINHSGRAGRRSVRSDRREFGLPLLGVVPEDPAVPSAEENGTALILRSRKGAAMACLHISRRLLGLEH